MRYRFLLSLLAGCVIGGLCLSGNRVALGSANPPGLNVVFQVETQDAELARMADSLLRLTHWEMFNQSGVSLHDTVRLVFAETQAQFDQLLGSGVPDWGAAAAVSEKQLIVMRSTSVPYVRQHLRELIRHELAHLHLDAIFEGERPPRWMHEGYAQMMAHEWRYGDDWTIARASLTGQLLNLRDIDGVNSFLYGKANLAYAQSYLAMSYFIEKYGWTSLRLFADALDRGGNWDDAFVDAIGVKYDGFAEEYAQELRRRYSVLSLLGDSAIFWIILVGFFFVLYLLKRHYSRAKERLWESEDAVQTDAERFWPSRRSDTIGQNIAQRSIAGQYPFRAEGTSRTDGSSNHVADSEDPGP